MARKVLLPSLAVALLLIAAVAFWRLRQPAFSFDPSLEATLNGITSDYRRIIVLVDGADALDAGMRDRAVAAGRILFWHKQAAVEELSRQLMADYHGRQALASAATRMPSGSSSTISTPTPVCTMPTSSLS